MKALLLIDIQNDFLPEGSLAVPSGDEVIAVANELMADFPLVVATKDWHPADHCSFASQHPGHRVGDCVTVDGLAQRLWPDHCVQNSEGAEFPHALNVDGIDYVVHKGTNPRLDSYSGFFDNARRNATELEAYLREREVSELHLVGLATDYCVRFTALDAINLGFRTTIVLEGVRGVNIAPNDSDKALADLTHAGARLL